MNSIERRSYFIDTNGNGRTNRGIAEVSEIKDTLMSILKNVEKNLHSDVVGILE